MSIGHRWYGSLKAPDVPASLNADSVLCLPIGSYEQHGPHLPLHTDTIIAERFTQRLVTRYGDQHDLWILPSVPYGLSLEHAWSPGTVSLRIDLLTRWLDTIVGEYVRATPARTLLIANGHGGNRGVLEPALYELTHTHGVTACVVHPSSLATVRADSSVPEIHAGIQETSVMLALAPDDVHLDRLPEQAGPTSTDPAEIRRQILDRGTTWPWSSGDPAIAAHGITGGDPRTATPQLGETIIDSAIAACAQALDKL